ncbi:MAG: ribonuclease R [Pseudomonadota bacterium]
MKSNPKRRKSSDPHASREAARYAEPIASREYILDIITNHGVPTTFERLCERLKISKPSLQSALQARLNAMVRDGQLVKNRKNGYVIVAKSHLRVGKIAAHPNGFGFFVPDEGGGDLYLHAKQMRQVLHGDRVIVRSIGEGRNGKEEGMIVEVIERAVTQIVGKLHYESGIAFVVSDNKRIHQDILIPPGKTGKAKPGQIVVANIIEQPGKRNPPVGAVTRVLGDAMGPGMEIESAIVSHGIPAYFPASVSEQADKFPDTVLAKDKKGRLDLRSVPLVTIDGEDARDFDDAVYCERRKGGGWKLIVSIADVSHYVKHETELDREAELRGTSVYFPQRVVPMLPEKLSNGLCSLNPNVDRLTMSCELLVSADGKLTRSRFHESLIRSHARLTYTEVGRIIDGQSTGDLSDDVLGNLAELHRLYKVLRKKRDGRGAIDFDTTETRIVFNNKQKIARIEPVVRHDAHKLIEECMILANVAAARFLDRHGIPALYRNHAPPSTTKLEDLRAFLMLRGLRLAGGDEPAPREYDRLLQRCSDRPDFHVIQNAVLRSLSQAVYSQGCEGHFGLALTQYAHFTSPIRRYPDLLVHRAIRYLLRKKKGSGYTYDKKTMERLGQHCSQCERRADEATRDVDLWLKCEYMQSRVGDVFSAVATTVTSFGVFAELDGIFVEGLVHITSLPKDYYHHDSVAQTLTGEQHGRQFSPGDKFQVEVLNVAIDERKIDLQLVGEVNKKNFQHVKRKRKPRKLR